MDPQIISVVGQLTGAAGGLGLIIWLVILVLKQVERGRAMDQESMGSQIDRLEKQVKELTDRVGKLDHSLDEERKERVAAQEQVERLRIIIIRHGLEAELDEH